MNSEVFGALVYSFENEERFNPYAGNAGASGIQGGCGGNGGCGGAAGIMGEVGPAITP